MPVPAAFAVAAVAGRGHGPVTPATRQRAGRSAARRGAPALVTIGVPSTATYMRLHRVELLDRGPREVGSGA